MSPRPRRRSIDSSDSDSDSSHKAHKDKKHKEYKHHKDHSHNYMSTATGYGSPSYFPTSHDSLVMPHFSSNHGSPSMPHFPTDHGSPAVPQFPSTVSNLPPGHDSPPMPNYPSGHGSPAAPQFPSDYAPAMPSFPPSHGIDRKSKLAGTEYNQNTLSSGEHNSPPPYVPALPSAPPSSGFRLPLTTTGAFPDPQTLGQPPCYDLDGSPIYIGSALMSNSVHPCKIGKHLQPCVSVPYGGAEHGHHGRYDLLPYRPDQMEFVPTSNGQIPYGRRPIEGGYEDHGAKLYHAVALINGIRVPGKTSEHLGGCNVAFGGAEHIIKGHYEILCWR